MARSKEAKELIQKIANAGGTVIDKGRGKILVTGPNGTVHIGDRVSAGRAMKQTISTIERYTGLTLRLHRDGS